jgi:signal transduction histidine kinase/CheY-like chemotaxis protein
MLLDAPLPTFAGIGFKIATLYGARTSGIGTMQQMSAIVLGLAGLSSCTLLFKSYLMFSRRRSVPPRTSVWLLGTLLALCGFLQFAGMVNVIPDERGAVLSLITAISCWGAAFALIPLVASKPEAHQEVNYEREIAERQRAEEALRFSEAETRKLVEADARKNEFLAMLGHELRNPLAPIRYAVKIMKQRGSDDTELCWARDVVDHQVRQMADLVDDLLEISRVTTGKVRLQKEPIDVATIVAFAVETSRPMIEILHHRLSIVLPPGPVIVDADSLRMGQVLANLLNNAAKYSKSGGQIRLAVTVEGAEAVFRVRDKGIGIPSEMLAQIFDLFTQVDQSLDHSQGGLGLGLTLVRNLVEMHGGRVSAHSDGLGQGSEFVVRLPILPESPARQAKAPSDSNRKPAPAHAANMRSRRVLVVDDNVSSAQSLAMILKLDGHDVQVAHDGAVALDAVGRFRPEAVLMDIGLPGMDGYEVALRLRERPELRESLLLLVAVTGYAEEEARRRSREVGFDHHLVKPVDPEVVLALLASLEWTEQNDNSPGKPTSAEPRRQGVTLFPGRASKPA